MPTQKTSRQSLSGKSWPRLRRVVQYLALLLFLILFVWSRRGGWPAEVVNVPMRLDPLAMLAQLLASRTLLAGSALALITVGLTLVLGRAWCGWLCPLGTVLDLFSFRRLRGRRAAPTDGWRRVKLLEALAQHTHVLLRIYAPQESDNHIGPDLCLEVGWPRREHRLIHPVGNNRNALFG